MEYIQGAGKVSVGNAAAVTLGKFDGLHRGHQKLIQRVACLGNENLSSVVFVLDPGKKGSLLSTEERCKMLEKWGVSCLIDCPMTEELMHMSPEQFVSEILVKKLKVKYLAVGSDYHFGYRREGDCQLLEKLGKSYGFTVDVVEKERDGDREISSTFVREELEKGNMELVNQLLGYSFFICGEVLHGRRIGRTLGMPTTNLVPSTRKLLPPNGVYVSETVIDGRIYPGITNIGYKPTVGESFRGVETNIFDFDGNLYGKDIEVRLLSFERPERKFESLALLKKQVETDIAFGRRYFQERDASGKSTR